MTDAEIVVFRGRANILDGYHPESGVWDPDEPVGKFLAARRVGGSLRSACRYAKISLATTQNWEARGREYSALVEDHHDLPIEQRVYADFFQAAEEKEGAYEVELAEVVRRGALRSPQLALAVLTKRFPDGWSEKRTIDVTSSDGSLVQDRVAAVLLANPAIARSAEELALALEAAVEDDEPMEA